MSSEKSDRKLTITIALLAKISFSQELHLPQRSKDIKKPFQGLLLSGLKNIAHSEHTEINFNLTKTPEVNNLR